MEGLDFEKVDRCALIDQEDKGEKNFCCKKKEWCVAG